MSDLSGPGAFFTQDIEETPVVVVRDLRGAIRAFMNICRHQGARLIHERSGITKSFTCILHGWNYDLEGQMGGGPLAKLAQTNPLLAQIRNTNALTPLPCEVRHGFVWVGVEPRGPIDVAAFLGPLDARLADVEEWTVLARDEVEVEGALEPNATTTIEVEADSLSIHVRCQRRGEGDFGQDIGGRSTATLVHWRLSASAPA